MSLTQAIAWNVRTCRCDAKRKLQARDTARGKVSMHGTGAETSVLVMILRESGKERREVVIQFFNH
ncbi:MAG: hypothetical protein ABI675_17810 [Chitinophagaceae bacterium]